ncbi:peptide-N-glycosidase F-related protein [uncultured Flavobacterium sp.]|uniref:peptide-N-glycosidase F-related protein n=1 Tax=uncultured Flavobacterium sp. TaxID=165435 RepID=UPI0025E754CB|nr:peptide-N-glycosidase F-related protein [uncultured Flavobacterium sp.]
MTKKLLKLSALAFLLAPFSMQAQEPYTLSLFDDVIFYNMYEGPVSEPVPAGVIRTTNSSYSRKLTSGEIESVGNTLTLNVTLSPLCDTYDRIGNVNLVMVPAGAASYTYSQADIVRIEMGRFITPFMNMLVSNPDEVPYTFEVDNIAKLLHDVSISANYDFWIELEVYGYQGDASAGAVHDLPNTCPGRNDVYIGSLELVSTNDPGVIQGDDNFFEPLSYKYELKNYTLAGTDVLGETVRTINFTLDEAVPKAKLYLITSNHGITEEFIRRLHYVHFDDEEVLNYTPGGVSCVPYRVFNTMPNCIYINCQTGAWRPNADWAWSWNNWCPGNKIPTHIIELGDLAAGEHSFKIEVPEAEFLDSNGNNGNGYFPVSAYLQGYSETLRNENFDYNVFKVFPNPASDIITIDTGGQEIKTVTIINTLGQAILESASDKIDLTQLESGIYMVNVLFANNVAATQKIVKK